MSVAVRYAAERTCDPANVDGYLSILFEIISCAGFETLAVDENGDVREDPPKAHGQSQAALDVRTLDDLTLQIDRATERRGGGASPIARRPHEKRLAARPPVTLFALDRLGR